MEEPQQERKTRSACSLTPRFNAASEEFRAERQRRQKVEVPTVGQRRSRLKPEDTTPGPHLVVALRPVWVLWSYQDGPLLSRHSWKQAGLSGTSFFHMTGPGKQKASENWASKAA